MTAVALASNAASALVCPAEETTVKMGRDWKSEACSGFNHPLLPASEIRPQALDSKSIVNSLINLIML